MDKRGWATTRFFAQINEWSRRLKTLKHGWEFLLIIGSERALFCVMQRDFIREFLSLFLQKRQFSQVYQKNKVFLVKITK